MAKSPGPACCFNEMSPGRSRMQLGATEVFQMSVLQRAEDIVWRIFLYLHSLQVLSITGSHLL